MRFSSVDAIEANKPFGELVLAKGRDRSEDQLQYTRDHFAAQLPPSLQKYVWAWLPAIEQEAHRAHFWRQFPDHAADQIAGTALAAHDSTRTQALAPTECEVLFWVVIFHFARQVQLDRRARRFVQEAVGVGVFRRLFESWPSEGNADLGWDGGGETS